MSTHCVASVRLTVFVALLLILVPRAAAQALSVQTIHGSGDLNTRTYAVEWMPEGRQLERITGFLLDSLNTESPPEAEPQRLGTGIFRD